MPFPIILNLNNKVQLINLVNKMVESSYIKMDSTGFVQAANKDRLLLAAPK